MSLSSLAAELTRTLRNLVQFIGKLEAQEYYSPNSSLFLKRLKEFAICLEDNFDEIPPNRHALLLRELNYHFIPLVRYVRRSETKEVPWSIIPNLEYMISRSLGSEYIILLRPQWHWNYSVLITDISDYLRSVLRNFIDDDTKITIPEKFHFISFPMLEKKNFLLHTVFGHELGHFYQEKYFSTQLTREWEIGETNRLIAKLTAGGGGGSSSTIVSAAHMTIRTYRGMVREIIPDMVGYMLLGPSMLFALYHLSLWNHDKALPNEKNDFYPPLKYRIRTLYDSFFNDDFRRTLSGQSTVFSKTMKDANKKIKDYLSDETDIRLLESEETTKEVLSMFLSSKHNIIDFCRTASEKIRYTYSEERIEKLVNRIEENIPPNEIDDKPVVLGDIFLSGWIYYFDGLSNNSIARSDYSRWYETLSRLLLKASNLSYVHQLFVEEGGHKSVHP